MRVDFREATGRKREREKRIKTFLLRFICLRFIAHLDFITSFKIHPLFVFSFLLTFFFFLGLFFFNFSSLFLAFFFKFFFLFLRFSPWLFCNLLVISHRKAHFKWKSSNRGENGDFTLGLTDLGVEELRPYVKL